MYRKLGKWKYNAFQVPAVIFTADLYPTFETISINALYCGFVNSSNDVPNCIS